MANIKPLDVSSDKWKRRSQSAGQEYAEGIARPRRPWAEASVAAADNYKTAVTQAANEGRFGKGVQAVGNQKWSQNAVSKGPSRFAEGVSLAVDEWSKGFAPIHQAISSLNLPARGPRGDARNLERVKAVTQAARAAAQKRS